LSDQVQDVNLIADQGHRWVSGLKSQMLIRLRGNQLFHLHIHEKEIAVERLPVWLDGLTVAHISDLHIGKHIDLDFQRQVIERTTQMQADMIVISGDIVDDETYLPQLADLLCPLTARYGAYFILGNHDLRIKDVRALRKLLTTAGMIDLGGRWQWVDVSGGRFVIAGNEFPWITPAADMSNCPTHLDQQHLFRLLVAHTPDQIDWAREHDFDLVLAGHMHGGQIRFPLIGPIVGPSRHGTKYASGTFYEPPTVMHVSRGVCGLTPIRLNCPPEISKLTLRRRSLQAP